MPGPTVAVRFAALTLFLVAVALGLWLLDVRPLLVLLGMAVALAIAWAIEWLAWRAEFGAPRPRRAILPQPEPAADVHSEALLEEGEVREDWEDREPSAPRAEPFEPEPEPAPAPGDVPSFLPAPAAEDEPRADASSGEPPAERPPGPRPSPRAEPEGEPAPKPEPEPELPPAAEAPESGRAVEPPRERPPLRPVPPPPPPPPAVTRRPARAESPVVPMRPRPGGQPREWNLWDLERLAREELKRNPARRDEWSYLFVHLRQYAKADGALPTEFDPLVRESFGGLLEGAPRL